ncbi:glycosyltransferase family 2 protein [Stenoxybacter acetivorans]|uniref:glycosyltransferase family 2 protein n=1 Tax=Stenoxybacter acetivorans TaxID=422441 RepID=UPI00068D8B5F|nr:glycosyltransferase [Stenoxybacter acetivorans]
MHPLVSVIIPFYNNEATLAETLHSALNSTYQQLEIIVIDDGSKQSPQAIIDRINSPKIRLLSQVNRGLAGARNAGVQIARGEFLLFLDSDDLIEPTYISKAVNILQDNPRVKLVSCWVTEFNERGENHWQTTEPSISRLLWQNYLACSNLLRKADFDALGGCDENLTVCEDWDLWIRLLQHDEELHIIPERLFRYRRHGAEHLSLTNAHFKNRDKQQQAFQKIYHKHAVRIIEHFGNPGAYQWLFQNYLQRSWYKKISAGKWLKRWQEKLFIRVVN